ncbi:HAD family hydrolase [Enterovibrio nigricans]|uniref:Haloacid dehalogenase superfamily, subfamily IA, variant 3 with third motif having DD or ED n=1 Tax=Enterovibrio nigricans DSM 22720 TaxID=1121868 RepID=A0A1T4W5K0_9GAMM|nr:HAD family phosphatase [Enterovibrio nigricans]PKF48880.1 HAD family phosphatase [Enterovibrio nigricans]SKA72325.1 haloacid dehalogenase superfamily, subfamily IA, variant 3 with third motif having DD or ED [Enterovibrio nigricans DSM 22720]
MLIKQKNVLFDMDGTLIDSRKTIEEAWLKAAQSVRVTIYAQDIEEHIHGRSGQYTLDHFFGHFSDNEKQAIKAKVDAYEETANTPLIEGAIEFLDKLKENDVNIGLVTGSWPARIEHVFELHNLWPYFNAVISRHDVKEGKPNPEGFKKCASLLGTSTDNCLIFEDSFSGFLAAEACGAPCVSVGDHNVSVTPNVVQNITDYFSIEFKF